MTLLQVDQVKKKYKVKSFGKCYQLMAVNGVSFSVEKGTCVGLVGESGCGKSTLGRIITGLEMPTEGRILMDGISLEERKKMKSTKHIQMVFQDSFDAVNPRYTAKQIIEEPLRNRMKITAKEREEKVEELLRQVGIPVSEKNKFALEFSGGQLQRVCIARALASDPDLIVLDEPLSSLDVSVQAQILNLLSDIKKERELSYLLISHDLEAVYYLSDAIIVMYGGQIMEKIDDIKYFDELIHPYTQRLLAASSYQKKREKICRESDVTEINIGIQKEGFAGCPYSGRCKKVTECCKYERPEIREIKKGHFVACHQI